MNQLRCDKVLSTMEVVRTRLNPAFKAPMLLAAASFALGIALVRLDPPTPLGASLLLWGTTACLLGGLVVLRADWRWASSLLALSGLMFAGAAAAPLFELRFGPTTSAT